MSLEGKIMIRMILISTSAIALTACNIPARLGPNPADPNPIAFTVTPTPTPNSSTPTIPSSTSSSPLGASLGIADSVDLRMHDTPVRTQFGETCTAFATAAAMNNVLKRKGIKKVVSERHLWSTYQRYDMIPAVAAAANNYLVEDKFWPSNQSAPNWGYQNQASLKVTRYQSYQYNLNAALIGLSQGHPLVMGVQSPESLLNCDETINPSSRATGYQHAMTAVGYQLDQTVMGGGYFIVKNSWGTGCGDQGYHYYPFSLCSRGDLFCYFTEISDVEDRAGNF